MEITKTETYNHYIALDWSQEIVAAASMSNAGTKVNICTIHPDIRLIKDYLGKHRGKKILTLEETTTSHWLYVELLDSVDKILVSCQYNVVGYNLFSFILAS